MSKIRRKKKDEENGEEWLATYADSITLLMCFFVMLLSVSEPKMDKFEALTEGFASGFVENMIELPFKTLYEDFQLIIEDQAVEQDVAVEFTDQGVQMDLNSSALFVSGSAELKQEALPLLEEMAVAIQEMDLPEYRVDVEGHTDDVPSTGEIFPSNWELSAARSARVVRFLIDQGLPPERMRAVGYAETRPKVPNLDPQSKPIPENRELNRRVILNIMRVLD